MAPQSCSARWTRKEIFFGEIAISRSVSTQPANGSGGIGRSHSVREAAAVRNARVLVGTLPDHDFEKIWTPQGPDALGLVVDQYMPNTLLWRPARRSLPTYWRSMLIVNSSSVATLRPRLRLLACGFHQSLRILGRDVTRRSPYAKESSVILPDRYCNWDC
jgi:hypothetical protein